jgi:superfamily I DNA/RNA helicase
MDIENEHSVIYVAITRARERLYIINVGNKTYDNFFQQYSTR